MMETKISSCASVQKYAEGKSTHLEKESMTEHLIEIKCFGLVPVEKGNIPISVLAFVLAPPYRDCEKTLAHLGTGQLRSLDLLVVDFEASHDMGKRSVSKASDSAGALAAHPIVELHTGQRMKDRGGGQ
jgi:hypothetical protein